MTQCQMVPSPTLTYSTNLFIKNDVFLVQFLFVALKLKYKNT